MSTSQTLSNIATGLRAVDCELAAMRSLNGTLVSALTTILSGGGPKHGLNFRMRCHDGAGMEWAMEIYEEMQREEGSESSDGQEWFDCEEWPRVEFSFDENGASVQRWDGRGNNESGTQ